MLHSLFTVGVRVGDQIKLSDLDTFVKWIILKDLKSDLGIIMAFILGKPKYIGN